VVRPPIGGHARRRGGSWWRRLFCLGLSHLARQLVAGLAGVRRVEEEGLAAALLGGCRCCTGLARRREDRERRSENGALGFARREPAAFCLPRIDTRPSDQILRLTTTGLEKRPRWAKAFTSQPQVVAWCTLLHHPRVGHGLIMFFGLFKQ
jgi:hypothetical protein